jgi:hypothetical protein
MMNALSAARLPDLRGCGAGQRAGRSSPLLVRVQDDAMKSSSTITITIMFALGLARDVAVGDLDGVHGDEILIVREKSEAISLRDEVTAPVTPPSP